MNIIHPNNSFDFTKLTLAQPISVQGGSYFTKINYNQSPLYIQTPKSFTKQGIIVSGKKLYCDLMFENQLNELIEWFEKLETTCQQLIFDKSSEWFQDPLQLNDIENVFNSILKIYKSGKFYLARVNVKKTINIYDETRNVLSIEDIKNDTSIISILEIQGIKFTSRTFQIEIELKQSMILDNSPVFNNCLISPLLQNNNIIPSVIDSSVLDSSANCVPSVIDSTVIDSSVLDSSVLDSSVLDSSVLDSSVLDSSANKVPSATVLIANNEEKLDISDDNDENDAIDYDDDSVDSSTSPEVELEFEELLEPDKKEDLIEITEINPLQSQMISEPLVLKKPNEVYYKIYREARTKAKEAKKKAILALLEAKNIKKTYFLDEIDKSDEEFDAEIENISESELFI